MSSTQIPSHKKALRKALRDTENGPRYEFALWILASYYAIVVKIRKFAHYL